MIQDVPIVGFTGPNGAGKTLVAVSECIADMRAGRPVYSTLPIASVHGDSLPILSMGHLLELRDCTVLLDEVAATFSSRDRGIPEEFDLFLQTLRHRGVTLRWTAPAWMRAEIRLREITQVAVNVFPLGRRRSAGSFWPRPLFIMAGALDTVGVPLDATPDKVLRRRVYWPSRLPGWGAYDTLADTPRIGHPSSGGSCVDCGGFRRREACTPERHQAMGLDLADASDALDSLLLGDPEGVAVV